MVLGRPEVRPARAGSGTCMGSWGCEAWFGVQPWCGDCEALLGVLPWVEAARPDLVSCSAWPAAVP